MNNQPAQGKPTYDEKTHQIFQVINGILAHNDKDKRIDKVFDCLLHGIEEYILKNPEKTFYYTVDFLNSFFKEIDVRKMYNNIPHLSLRSYAQQALGFQLLHNVYDTSWQNFYKGEMNGGDCHYWTVLLWKLFEILKQKGLPLITKNFVYKGEGGHSGLLIQYEKKWYLADVSGFNDPLHRLITSVSLFNQIYKTREFSLFTYKKPPQGASYFNDLEEFIEEIENKPKTCAAVKFCPTLEQGTISQISFKFHSNHIDFSINEQKKIYLFDKNIKKYLKKSDAYYVLDVILKHIIASPSEKQALGEYFQMIRHKISQDALYAILRGSTKEENLLRILRG